MFISLGWLVVELTALSPRFATWHSIDAVPPFGAQTLKYLWDVFKDQIWDRKDHLDSVVTEEVWRKRSSYSSGQALHVRTSSPGDLLEKKQNLSFPFSSFFWNSPSRYLHPCQAPILLLDIWARLVSQFRRRHLPQKWLLWSIKH